MPASKDPIIFFNELYEQYRECGIAEPSAMALATATRDGIPSVRIVLLKAFDDHGFVFFTNLNSRKSRDLQHNPRAALCFFWDPIQYQIRVEGSVEPVAEEEADTYFATRPRGSQIGAWASKQSSPMRERKELQERVMKYAALYKETEVPRPKFWSGFRLIPEKIEFWRREENRLHERTIYSKTVHGWEAGFLFP